MHDARKYAAELVALAPDVILARAGSTVAPLQQATRTVPIVFAQAADPVGAGFVASLVRPSGNATGFTQFEYGSSGKWFGIAQRDCAACDASGGPSGFHQSRRHWPVGRQPGRGRVNRSRGETRLWVDGGQAALHSGAK
jgi:hypothetical protein